MLALLSWFSFPSPKNFTTLCHLRNPKMRIIHFEEVSTAATAAVDKVTLSPKHQCWLRVWPKHWITLPLRASELEWTMAAIFYVSWCLPFQFMVAIHGHHTYFICHWQKTNLLLWWLIKQRQLFFILCTEGWIFFHVWVRAEKTAPVLISGVQ